MAAQLCLQQRQRQQWQQSLQQLKGSAGSHPVSKPSCCECHQILTPHHAPPSIRASYSQDAQQQHLNHAAAQNKLQRTMQGQVNSHIYTALQRQYVMPSTASTAASRFGYTACSWPHIRAWLPHQQLSDPPVHSHNTSHAHTYTLKRTSAAAAAAAHDCCEVRTKLQGSLGSQPK
jgi:hypothetical protein